MRQKAEAGANSATAGIQRRSEEQGGCARTIVWVPPHHRGELAETPNNVSCSRCHQNLGPLGASDNVQQMKWQGQVVLLRGGLQIVSKVTDQRG